ATSDIHLKYKLRKNREEILDMAISSIEYAKSHGLYVSFNAEDGTRTDFDFLIEFTKKCAEAGGDRLRLCDTVSALQPFATKYLVKKIKESVNIPIEIHAHNDYGLAVANSLAAIEGGAEYVSTTINGIGERAGNCSLEQLVMCLKCLYNIDVKYKTEILKKMSEYVENASNIKVSPNAPIVGENAFRHESGIHVNGLIKFPYTYETYPPEMVGQKRKFVIGKQSGKSAIKEKLKEYDIECDDDKISEILKEVKLFAENRKSALSDEEFLNIAKSVLEGGDVFIAVEVVPKKRHYAYEEISKIPDIEVYEVMGDIDLILKVPKKNVSEIIEKISNISGVSRTTTYNVVKKW
ncbi:MAG: Lrp/AsnC ligand binding domain-containing protein, partial [Candidatus Altarchaeaceae archaeon]